MQKSSALTETVPKWDRKIFGTTQRVNNALSADKVGSYVNASRAIYEAISTGQDKLLSDLLATHANTDLNFGFEYESFYIPNMMFFAVAVGNSNAVQLLNAEKAMCYTMSSEFGLTLMHYAAAFGQQHIMEFLFTAGLSYNLRDGQGATPLHYAASYGRQQCIEFLCKEGVSSVVTDNQLASPMHYATFSNCPEVLQCLYRQGAPYKTLDMRGATVLHYAASYGKLKSLEFTHKQGIAYRVSDNSGITPMHDAASNGAIECMKYLNEQGISYLVTDIQGATPLHYAAKYGQIKCIEFLASQGILLDIVDNNNFKPIHYAAQTSQHRCINYLRGKANVHYNQSSQISCIKIYPTVPPAPLNFVSFTMSAKEDSGLKSTKVSDDKIIGEPPRKKYKR